MVKIGFKGEVKEHTKLYVEDCRALNANRLHEDDYGGSAVYRGYTLLGYCRVHPSELVRLLGWSL